MKYEIWSEGFVVTGQAENARLVAEGVGADSFEEACAKHYRGDNLYDATKNTYWGCKLFPTEEEARASFG